MQRATWAALAVFAAGCAAPQRAPPPAREGLRAVEGEPMRGMAWRLWLPREASPRRRLVVWLHPSLDSGETFIEPLAPLFARHGYALLVPLKSEVQGWTSEDVQVLFKQVLPRVAQDPGVDATEPLIIGWSAGGQMALHLWQTAPEALGGVVLVGTTPELLPFALPAREATAGTAVLSIVGSLERGAPDWTNAVSFWRARGIPLTLKIVPGRAHEWLFDDGDARAFLETWLAAIAAPSPAERLQP